MILEIPWSHASLNKNPGCEKAPKAILKEIENIFLSEEGHDKKIESKECKVYEDNYEKTIESIESAVQKHKPNIILGGDHSISYPCVKASGCDGLIVLDAHPDAESDIMPPSHEDFIQALVNQKIIHPQKIILFGLRNMHQDELTFLKKHNINYFTAKEISFLGLEEATDSMMSIAKKFKRLYLSIDIDVLDAVFAPGTGYPEVGGFTSRELLYILHRLKNMKNLSMIDLVEINPDLDKDLVTVKTGAKILKELNILQNCPKPH